MFNIYRLMLFYFEKGLNGQMHFSSDLHHLIKNQPLVGKPWSVAHPGSFWHTVNYTTSGYMLNVDGHLMD